MELSALPGPHCHFPLSRCWALDNDSSLGAIKRHNPFCEIGETGTATPGSLLLSDVSLQHWMVFLYPSVSVLCAPQ